MKYYTAALLFPLLTTAQDTPSVSPTTVDANATNDTNDCDTLVIGDFTFLLVSSSDPFDELSFFGFDSFPPNLDLYLTDNAWNGNSFQTTEGVLQLTTPPQGIPAGVTVGVGPASDVYQFGDQWNTVQGAFALSQEGDQVFLYCISSDSKPRPIAAISYHGDFVASDLLEYGTNTSAVPQELLDNGAAIVLPPGQHRWYYNGPINAEINQMKANIQDTNNWAGTTGPQGSGVGKQRTLSWIAATAAALMTWCM